MRPHIQFPNDRFWECAPVVLEEGLGIELKISAVWMDTVGSDDKMEAVLRTSASGRLSVHAPFEEMCPLSRDPQIRAVSQKRLEDTLDFCIRVKARSVVYHSSYEPLKHEWWREDFLDQAAEFFGGLARKGAEHGVGVNLENVFEQEPEVLREIMDRSGTEALGWCFDLGHYNFLSKVPLIRWFELLGDRLRHCHLHENYGKTDDHLPLGTCGLDTLGILSSLPKDCIPTLEHHTVAHVLESLAFLRKNAILDPETGTFSQMERLN